MKITIPIEPVAKSRPKFGKGHAYTPEKTKVFEESVRWYMLEARSRYQIVGSNWPHYEMIKKPTPVKVSITFYLTQPKRSKWDYPTGKPDIDNLEKSICDAAEGILYENDSQIIEKHSYKWWARKEGYIEMEVEEWTFY